MFGLGAGELFVILFLALIFIGPKKLPQLARGLGRGFREFQKAKSDFMTEMHRVEGPIKEGVESVRTTAKQNVEEWKEEFQNAASATEPKEENRPPVS